MISALIFDFDGTIIDTESAWYYAYRDIYADYQIELPLELWGQCIGTTFASFDPHQYLIQQSGVSINIDEIKRVAKEKYNMHMLEQKIRPGVLDYLDTAQQMGLKLAIASSSERHWIDHYLDVLDIRKYFDHVVTADDVAQVKPDPELYLEAIKRLKVPADSAIAFEDSKNGLIAAKAANLYCVIVPNEVTKYMDFEHYDDRIESMNDKNLEAIIEEASGKI